MSVRASLIPLLVAGPTASGKSAFALTQSKRVPSVIINADSMQVYRDLRVLTARPAASEEAATAHALYGHVDGAHAYSVGQYVREMAVELARARELGLRPIIVGGTGLYFKALLEGLSPVPTIPEDVRGYWRAQAQFVGAAELHAMLAARDSEMARRLRPSDPQRVTRALEVLEATGRSLAEWQAMPGVAVIDIELCERVVIVPDRAILYTRADLRFDAMIANGALDEVATLAGRNLDPALPVMRALGVPQLLAHVRGETPLAKSIEETKLETRRYIKRQLSWARRNMCSWNSNFAQLIE